MTRFIVLFRGVGGKTQLPTAPLREKLGEAGFRDVATYINSGNALVTTRKSRETAMKEIATICRRDFAFEKDIYLVSAEEWEAVIENNPFPDATDDPKFLHAAWLAAEPDPVKVKALQEIAQGRDRIEVVGNVAYVHTPEGFGTSKLAEKFDKGIGVPNTARNWNTVLKLRELAGKAEN